jgi:predicted flap endonuclease-1-like 5' DNA nuclease
MTYDTFLSLMCTTLIASFFGLVLVFTGYKLFRFLLPIWGFFFGFFLGAQTVQALFSVGFLTTATSWITGLIVGVLFAVLAYPFYIFGVGLIAASLGYMVAVGFLLWIGMSFGFWMWLIAIIVGIAVATVTIIFDLQRWLIVIGSTVLGAGVIVSVITLWFRPHAVFLENPVKVMLQLSPLLLILFLALVILGIIVQFRTTRGFMEAAPETPAKSTPAPTPAVGGPVPGAVVAGATGMATAEEVMKPAAPVEPVVMDSASTPTSPEELDKFKYNLDYIEGIGPVYAGKLRAIGINNPLDLLEKGAFPKGREEIAATAGISSALVLTWVNHVDLFRIKGVGSEYADLLERAGVDTVVELALRNPDNLFAKMVAVNEEKHLVRKLPVLSQVQDWVGQAKVLPRKVNY